MNRDRPAARLIKSPEIRDGRGGLTFVERDRLPFTVQRLFMLYDIPAGSRRGGHAHREQEQLIVMAAGSCIARVDNGSERREFRLDRRNEALHVPAMVWLDLEDFTDAAVCVVLASGLYDEADYIRDRAGFDRLVSR
jgi:hypothetical protein